MYKTQYKARSPYDSWIVVGSYGTEAQAISAAIFKKNRGAILVRVLDKKGAVIYTG
jgi:hypothetical protein